MEEQTTQTIQKTNNGPLTGVFRVWAWILLVWSAYRYFLEFSEPVDEFIFKPLIFLGPIVYYVLYVEKRPLSSLGITKENLFPSLYAGFGIGFLFALEGIAANYIKHGTLTILPIQAFQQYGFFLIPISLATAISEELLARGFLFNRFFEKSNGNLIYAAVYSTAMFIALHMPILLTSLKFQGVTLIMYFLTTITLSLANAIFFRYSRSIVGPILVHVFWNMTVALYL